MKTFQTKLLILVTVIFTLTSCAKVYYSPEAYEKASRHKVISIMPPSVALSKNKKMTAEELLDMEAKESQNFQEEMQSWMLKRKMQGRFNKKIQDITTTNALLERAGYYDQRLTTEEVCKALDVDGLIVSNFTLAKPMSTGGAIALGVLFGVSTTTNKVGASLSIKDCKSGDVIYNFDHKMSGSVGSSSESFVSRLMSLASKKMPYKEKK